MRESLSKRSPSGRTSASASASRRLKSVVSSKVSKKKSGSARVSGRLVRPLQKPSKLKSVSKSAKPQRKSIAAKTSSSKRAAKALKPSKSLKTRKAATSARNLKSAKAAKSLKSLKSLQRAKVKQVRKAGSTRVAKRSGSTQRSKVKAIAKTKKASGRAAKVTRKTRVVPGRRTVANRVPEHTPRFVERVVLFETPRRQPSSGALRGFEHAVRVFNRRHFGEARDLFEAVQRRFPQEVEIIARSQTYIQVCHQKLQKAPSSPRDADELYDRGVFALNTGDVEQARQLFEKALRLKPDEPHILYSLAAAHAKMGSHDVALGYLDDLVQMHPRFRTQAMNDSDFSGLHEDKRFLDILGVSSVFDLLDSRS
jgi:Tetratricopeptide repeat